MNSNPTTLSVDKEEKGKLYNKLKLLYIIAVILLLLLIVASTIIFREFTTLLLTF